MVPLIAHESHLCFSWTCFFALMVHCASLLSSSIAPPSRLLCCSYVKGIRALCEASLLCRIERNRSHDDEYHRPALDVRDVSYLSAGNTHELVARMKFS